MKLKVSSGLLEQVRTYEEERKLIDQLRDIGLDEYIELPQIAVMGDTSSGKSSLLSALSGISFPSSDQLTTRCPTRVLLTRADTFRGSVRLIRFQTSANDGGENKKREEIESLNRMEDVPDAITKLTKKLVSEGQYISDDEIVIEMSGPNLPNLTLTDLPGLVRTVGDNEDQSIISRIRQIVNRYMQQERTIILAVVPANVDMHNTEILQAAQEADPSGTRTIAVITKLDLVDTGAEVGVHELLLNKKKCMKLGYHAVKCRNQLELTNGTTIEKSVVNEMSFFSEHPYWRRLPNHLWGVSRLVERLVSILQDNVRRSLPKVIEEINTRMVETQYALSSLGLALETPGAQRQRFGKWVNQYLRMMEAAINGQYELLPPNAVSFSSVQSEARLRAVLRQKDLIFRAEIEAKKANDVLGTSDSLSSTRPSSYAGFQKSKADVAVGDRVTVQVGRQKEVVCKVVKTNSTDVLCEKLPHEWLGASRWQFATDEAGTSENKNEALKQFIAANRGDELAIFPSYRIFCSCVQRSVIEWERPALQLLEHYHTQTGSVSSHLISVLLADSDNVRSEQFFKETSKRVLGKLQEGARQELKLLLQQEARPYTQDTRLYDELDRLRQQALSAKLEAALPRGDTCGRVSLIDVTRALEEILSRPFAMSLDDREVLEMEIALSAYLKVASHRFIDMVPIKLNEILLKSFLREMENELLEAASDEKVAELLQENSDKVRRRQQLFTQLSSLKKGKQIIETSTSW
ncbi:unnamed protein product [Peronospora farinosa]|uniref:Uncharacterized protein n=1 Tax=Peronospora farinosa TaxID=134698 RepID=A0AAV0UR77_9STRA|nr:unnamed protein product [Peronospora farinosa]CAI5738793.1 unnamed protein product [Peronospora farinosa]